MSASVTCRLIEVESVGQSYADGGTGTRLINKATGEPPIPGDMWFDPETIGRRSVSISDYYFANNADRPPLCVVLPNGSHFVIDGKFYNAEQGYYGGWTVTGEPPLITVTPSINLVGQWHGWLTHGELRTA